MISMLFSSSSVSNLLWSSVICSAAALGGLLVFVGLSMEGSPSEKPFTNVDVFRRHKSQGKWGWRILMFGIVVEIVVAVWFAARDIGQVRQIKKEIAANDPRNLPISSLTATAWLWLKGVPTNRYNWSYSPEASGEPSYAVLDLHLDNPPNEHFLLESHRPAYLESTGGEVSRTNLALCIIKFENSPADFMDNEKINITKVDGFQLVPFFLGDNVEVVKGSIAVVFNSTVRQTFPVLAAKIGEYKQKVAVVTTSNLMVP